MEQPRTIVHVEKGLGDIGVAVGESEVEQLVALAAVVAIVVGVKIGGLGDTEGSAVGQLEKGFEEHMSLLEQTGVCSMDLERRGSLWR